MSDNKYTNIHKHTDIITNFSLRSESVVVLNDIGILTPAHGGQGLDLEEECSASEVLRVESPGALTKADGVLLPILLGIAAESHTVAQDVLRLSALWCIPSQSNRVVC